MKRAIIIVILFIVIVGMAFGIMKFLAAQKELPQQRKSPEVVRYVETEDVVYQNISSTVTGKGRVYSVSSVDIVAEGSGKILEGNVPLKNGQIFKKGDVLFSIYKDEVELSLKARKSNFQNTIANLLPDINIDFKESYVKMLNFFNSIEIEKDLPEMPKINSNQLKMFLASRNIMSEYYSILKDELALKRYVTIAPFDGTYNVVNLEVGAYTNVGGRVAKVIRTDIVEVEVAIDAENASFIKVGDTVDLIGEKSWQGKVVRISGYVDEGTQSRLVYVKVGNHKKMPMPGQYLKATFKGQLLENVMEIPRSAVFNFNEVYTIVDGRLMKREINLIKRNERTVLFSGLEEGTVVVIQPLIGVSDGSKVSRLKDASKEMKTPSNVNGKKN